MKIEDYNKAMDEIHADRPALMKKLLNESCPAQTGSTFPKYRAAIAAVLALFLLVGGILRLPVAGADDVFTITARAAGTGESIPLSTEPVFIQPTADAQFQLTWETQATVNYQLGLQCEGENIAQITYRCSDSEITRDNFGQAPRYFVANHIVPAEEYDQYDYVRRLQYTTEQGEGEEVCHLVELIGNECTVSYEAQDSLNLGIELNARTEPGPDYDTDGFPINITKAEPFTIDVILTFTDSTTQTKMLYLEPMEDAFEGISIRVME